MASVKKTLFELRGEVTQIRRGLPPNLIDKFINARVRSVLNERTYWSDLIVRGVLTVPEAYRAGTVSVTQGSPQVVGTGVAWPVSDQVNTTIRDGIFETGNQRVFPALMAGINESSFLLVDAGGTPETVTVNRIDGNSFWATFAYPHNQDCTVTQSSLVGRQFRMGSGSPIFDVLNVIDPQTLTISQPWGNIAMADQQYTLIQMYYTIVPNLKKFGEVVDRQQGSPILTNRALKNINWQDPQRTASGDPIALVDIGASLNGLSLYELWPSQTGPRQIDYCVYTDWPELVEDNDRLPWFLDPSIFKEGALADAYIMRMNKEDFLFNPQVAALHEAKFRKLVDEAKNADESRMMEDYTSDDPLMLGGGYGTRFYQTHVNGWGGGDWAWDL